MDVIEKLIEISSEPLVTASVSIDNINIVEGISKEIINELFELLIKKNGFFAFESALLILPTERAGGIPSLQEWNEYNRWKRYYPNLKQSVLFFSQDVFACKFGITSSDIIRFDPETGEVTNHSDSLAEWVSKVLVNYDYETGWSVAKKWQEKNGPLPRSSRLIGEVPFVLGGEYAAPNMKAIELTEAMEKLGGLYNQIKNIPDGEKVTVKGWIK